MAALAMLVAAVTAPSAPAAATRASHLDIAHSHAIAGLSSTHAQHLSKFGKPAPGQTYHDGLYVTTCEDLTDSYRVPGENRSFSQVATYFFDELKHFKVDFTIYVGDVTCVPSASDVYIKMFVTGLIEYNRVPGVSSVTGATYQAFSADFVIPSNIRANDLREIQDTCGPHQCGVNWETQPGTLVHTVARNCRNVPSPLPTGAPDICRWVAGQPFYDSFQYSTGLFYANEGAWEKLEGQTKPLNYSNRVTWVQPSHNSNPQECSLIYTVCNKYVTDAADACASCDRLNPDDPDSKAYTENFYECDGCVYRQTRDPSQFSYCCPCFNYLATKLNAPYMAHLDC